MWVFTAINPDSYKYILFSEFVHMTSFYVMLGPKELTKFLFQCADVDNKSYLNRQQFNTLMAELGEVTSPCSSSLYVNHCMSVTYHGFDFTIIICRVGHLVSRIGRSNTRISTTRAWDICLSVISKRSSR